MKKTFIPLMAIAITFSLFSCSENSKENHNLKEGKGGIFLGGIMRLNEVESFSTLNPISIGDIVPIHIGKQLFEGLVKFNQKDLSIQPAIARSWESNENQTMWIFHLRQGILFHSDSCFPEFKGRTLIADDIKFCFDKLCSSSAINSQYDVTFKDRVAGANTSYEASKKGKQLPVSGIKVIDDSTLSISLTTPCPGFLNVLAMPGCWIYPKEALDKYGADMRIHPVGTGPFILETLKENEVMILKKNPDYYAYDDNGNRLPYLDGVKYTFIREKKTEILEFKAGHLDMVYRLPVEFFHDLMGDLSQAKERQTDFQILNSPAFNTHFIGFNCTSDVFNKKEVRLAFNFAIDRKKIADFTIQGEGTPADYGMVPYVKSFEKDGYDFKKLRGYVLDIPKAKAYLKKAGYPDGKGFPKVTLEINGGGGDRNIVVAEVIQKMLKENLNIDIDINTVPMTEHLQNIYSGKSEFFRLAWLADYPDPETFLTLFYGQHLPKNKTLKSYINHTRFKNEKFDSLFSASIKESDKTKRYELLSEAEQILLEEAAFMPIFYEENFFLEQLYVRNFPENAMNYIDLSTVYMLPKDKVKK